MYRKQGKVDATGGIPKCSTRITDLDQIAKDGLLEGRPTLLATPDDPISDEGKYLLRLFVTGATPLSRRAILNINAICNERLKGKYDLEVIDIHQHPALAQDEEVMAAPTLIKDMPLPLRRIVGDLSDHDSLLAELDLER
jgi:circadian clock protein KaiB